jgi:hypothetical protein
LALLHLETPLQEKKKEIKPLHPLPSMAIYLRETKVCPNNAGVAMGRCLSILHVVAHYRFEA